MIYNKGEEKFLLNLIDTPLVFFPSDAFLGGEGKKRERADPRVFGVSGLRLAEVMLIFRTRYLGH